MGAWARGRPCTKGQNMFFSDKVFLENQKAIELYDLAKDLPIFDFHCHLSPQDILQDKVFHNLSELWLEGDHYKWRVMRAYGIDEKFVTGDADPKEKFLRFAEALPHFVGNPVYHWAHLELKKYFGLTLPICPDNAEEIWQVTLEKMSDGSFSARKLIAGSGVEGVVTTDDPTDDLLCHQALQKENLPFKVMPCFRADRLINIEKADYLDYVKKLERVSGVEIKGFNDLLTAVERRLDFFVDNGARSVDVGMENFPKGEGDLGVADDVLDDVLSDNIIFDDKINEFKFTLLAHIAKMLRDRNMVMQLHVGVMRNCNTALYEKCGVDAGGDSVANPVDVNLAREFFDFVEINGGLPKTMVYTLNPTAYPTLSTLIGDFQGEVKGKIQLGAAWWFEDHRDGIKKQMRALASTGGLGLFVGMLTDSRSFTSYARHDYFRRIFCSLIGEWVESGEYPDDDKTLTTLIENVCIENAKKYFGV